MEGWIALKRRMFGILIQPFFFFFSIFEYNSYLPKFHTQQLEISVIFFFYFYLFYSFSFFFHKLNMNHFFFQESQVICDNLVRHGQIFFLSYIYLTFIIMWSIRQTFLVIQKTWRGPEKLEMMSYTLLEFLCQNQYFFIFLETEHLKWALI